MSNVKNKERFNWETVIPKFLIEDLAPYILNPSNHEISATDLQEIARKYGGVFNDIYREINQAIKDWSVYIPVKVDKINGTNLTLYFENRAGVWLMALTPSYYTVMSSDSRYTPIKPHPKIKSLGYFFFEVQGTLFNPPVFRTVKFDPSFDVRPEQRSDDHLINGNPVFASQFLSGVYNYLQDLVIKNDTSNPQRITYRDIDEGFDDDLINACKYLLSVGLQTHSQNSLYVIDHSLLDDPTETINSRSTAYYTTKYVTDKEDVVRVFISTKIVYKNQRFPNNHCKSVHVNLVVFVVLKDGVPFMIDKYSVQSSSGISVGDPLPQAR